MPATRYPKTTGRRSTSSCGLPPGIGGELRRGASQLGDGTVLGRFADGLPEGVQDVRNRPEFAVRREWQVHGSASLQGFENGFHGDPADVACRLPGGLLPILRLDRGKESGGGK